MKRYEFVLTKHIAYTVFIDAENQEEAEEQIEMSNDIWDNVEKYGDDVYDWELIEVTDPKDEA